MGVKKVDRRRNGKRATKTSTSPPSEFVGEEGELHVRQTINHWQDVWIPFPAAHDKGIDGIIQFNRTVRRDKFPTRTPTGQLVMVQIKAGKGYLSPSRGNSDFIQIKLGKESIEKHRKVWGSYFEPVILVYVLPKGANKSSQAWWTDLRNPISYSPKNRHVIILPKSQTFGFHSKGHIRKLRSTLLDVARLPRIKSSTSDAMAVRLTKSPKETAKLHYRAWARSSDSRRTNEKLGVVRVSRSGWRHITRKGRSQHRILQSFMLIPVASKMIREVGDGGIGYLGHFNERSLPTGVKIVKDYVGLRAIVTFPHRSPSIVQVILRRRRVIDPDLPQIDTKLWFHSVYELGRVTHHD